ncbi:MAG: hypothetical protein K0S60_771 [Evtepia sp.]|jgi:hypothetical protein|nr:hypothetical protein [Evtepia sp.]
MSLIACTDPCVYQKDGYCSLSRAVSGGYPTERQSCVHYLPKNISSLQNSKQSLSNISNINEM